MQNAKREDKELSALLVLVLYRNTSDRIIYTHTHTCVYIRVCIHTCGLLVSFNFFLNNPT